MRNFKIHFCDRDDRDEFLRAFDSMKKKWFCYLSGVIDKASEEKEKAEALRRVAEDLEERLISRELEANEFYEGDMYIYPKVDKGKCLKVKRKKKRHFEEEDVNEDHFVTTKKAERSKKRARLSKSAEKINTLEELTTHHDKNMDFVEYEDTSEFEEEEPNVN